MLSWIIGWLVDLGDLVWWAASFAVGGIPTLLLFRMRRKKRAKPYVGIPADVRARRWLAVVLLVSSLGAAGLWIDQATATLCGLIGTYWLLSGWSAYRQLVRIGEEQRVCGEAIEETRKLQSHESLAKRLKDSAAKRVLLVVKNLGSRRADCDVGALVREEIAPFDAGLEVIHADAQVTQAKGLLGTLCGLAFLFAGLQAALANPNPQVANAEAAAAMGSLGTAFYTTIAATFGANLVLVKLHSEGYLAVRRLEAELIALINRSHFS